MYKNIFKNSYLHAVLMPAIYGLVLKLLFGLSDYSTLFSVMSLGFLFIVPFVMGALTIYFSPHGKTKSNVYTVFMPWLSMFVFFITTILLKIEGWACWLMVSPLFFLLSSIGGFIGRAYQKTNNNVMVSAILLLPFLFAPIENYIGAQQKTFKAYNYIDINAPADKIWQLVTRVSKIKETEDSGWLNKALGFPRPVEAELNYEGVGAYRKAIFTNGLVFHETVTAYEHQKKMVFSIKANPHEIPSTTLDEHVVVGGKFFDVLNGTYELEKLNDNKYRLHLYSHFVLNTTFNFYAGIWAKWIMKDIQRNILEVEKKRAES